MRIAALLLVLLLLSIQAVDASCGVGSCTVNTGQETQGLEDGLQTWVDLRYENYTMDVPRQGTRPVAVGEVPKTSSPAPACPGRSPTSGAPTDWCSCRCTSRSTTCS